MPQTIDTAANRTTAASTAAPRPRPASLPSQLLRDVSRSFYLTLRVLPAAIRQQIGLAYLLARATDTIADTDVLPVGERLSAIDELRARIMGSSRAPPNLGSFLGRSVSPTPGAVRSGPEPSGAAQPTAPAHTAAERALLDGLGQALELLASLAPQDQRLIREVLAVIISGQELDLRRFGEASATSVCALDTDAELDDYIYRVAGCVGEFWTKMCRARVFPDAPLDDAWLLAKSVRFGRGLQLVNILRDLPRDLRQGRCYLPRQLLATRQLTPQDLLASANLGRLRPLYNSYLDEAESCLADGWAYTTALPSSQPRVRLACAWPTLIGVKTLACLRVGNVLDPRHPVKITRAEVRNLMLRSVIFLPWRAAWDRLFEKARRSRPECQ